MEDKEGKINMLESNNYERAITLDTTFGYFEINLKDLVFLKTLLDKESYNMIEDYGEEIKRMEDYQRLVKCRKIIKGMMTVILDKDWKELEHDERLSLK